MVSKPLGGGRDGLRPARGPGWNRFSVPQARAPLGTMRPLTFTYTYTYTYTVCNDSRPPVTPTEACPLSG